MAFEMNMKKTALFFASLMMLSTPLYALTLKVATLSPDGSAWMSKMRAGASEIETKTQKRVVFKFYTGGTMGNDRAVLNKIKIGQLHGGALTAGSCLKVWNREEWSILVLPKQVLLMLCLKLHLFLQ